MVNCSSTAAFKTALERSDLATAARLLDETNNFENLGPARGEFLRFAVELCSVHGVKMLLERGIRLTPEQAGVRPLLPSSGDNLVLCRMLVELGVDVNERSAYGSTALHRAVMFDQPDVCAYLLAQGADPNLFDSDHKAPMHHLTFANEASALIMTKALVAAGARSSIAPSSPAPEYVTPFQNLVEDGRHAHVVDLLIGCGEDLDQSSANGRMLEQITVVTRMKEVLRSARTKQQIDAAIGGAEANDEANQSCEVTTPRRRAPEPF